MKKVLIGILGLMPATALMWAASSLEITKQPESQTVNEGDPVTFSVSMKDAVEGYLEGENFTTLISSAVNLDMVWCPPETFIMGSPDSEIGDRWFEIQHQETLSYGFWIGKYEAIIGNNPSTGLDASGHYGYFGVGANRPVYWVSYHNAKRFCEKLTEIERAARRLSESYEYTLPSEAQWEYACRTGTTTAFNNGTNILTEVQSMGDYRENPNDNFHCALCPNLDEVGWYRCNSGGYIYDEYYGYWEGGTIKPAGQKLPNAWRLYDIHGNVRECVRSAMSLCNSIRRREMFL